MACPLACPAPPADWLRLTLTDGWGPRTVNTLLEHFGSVSAVLQAPTAALAAQVGAVRAQALQAPNPAREQAVAHTLAWVASHPLHHLVTLSDPDYPALLRALADAPPVLYVHGQRAALQRPMLGVVGARNATATGTLHARRFARALSEQGWLIVSGLARGIDGAAHDGALAGAAGTVAVVGTGVDVIYPAAHKALAERIVAQGALISEFPLGTRPAASQFPRRNRIIAGLAHGVLVVEAAVRSGSLITARLAADCGREVFAIPGSIDAPLARGCHALLRDGAKLVESAQDILEELTPPSPARAAPSAQHAAPESTPDEPPDALLAAVGHAPVHPDTLAAHLALPTPELSARLVLLELSGHLQRLPDGRVQRPPVAG